MLYIIEMKSQNHPDTQYDAPQILAMIFSITGIVLFAYVDAAGELIWGVIIAVTSSSLTAVHKVTSMDWFCLLWFMLLLLLFI